MKARAKKIIIVMLPALAALVLILVYGWQRTFRARAVPPSEEIPVTVEPVQPFGEGLWLVPREVLDPSSGPRAGSLARLNNLRAERMAVEALREAGDKTLIRNPKLKEGDLLIRQPGRLTDGQAVIPQGLADEKLLQLTIDAGLAALRAEELYQSLRFISPDYRDSWGFNYEFLQKLLKRAFREFDEMRLELAADPEIRIQGHQAMVQARVRLTGRYQGRRNFLLGDRDAFNALVFQFEKTGPGWKLTNLKGLRPLGFEERFFRLLGGDIGLPLTEDERRDKQAACMPCRERMAERFGTYKK